MKAFKTILKSIFLTLSILITIYVIIINIIGTRADMPKNVNSKNILAIKTGMSVDEVIKILGRPFLIKDNRGVHFIKCKHPRPSVSINVNNDMDINKAILKIKNDTNYCCDASRDSDKNSIISFSFTYTRPVFLCKYYPMLWIHFDKQSRVKSVFAKQYFYGSPAIDDVCIYSMKDNNQDVFDKKLFFDSFK